MTSKEMNAIHIYIYMELYRIIRAGLGVGCSLYAAGFRSIHGASFKVHLGALASSPFGEACGCGS